MNSSKNDISDAHGLSSIMGPSSGGSNFSSRNNSMIGGSRITHQLKIILLGDISVGKTALFTRFTENTFPDEYKCTISIDFRAKSISLDQSTCAQLEVWDTCGEEKYRSLTRQYYRKSHGMILIFDLTCRKSFDALGQWLTDINANGDPQCEIIIVGNKKDLDEKRQVSKEEAEKFIHEKGYDYIEVSAKTGFNVELLFEKIAYKIVKRLQEKHTKEDIDKNQENFLKKKALDQRLREQDKKRDVGCC